MATEPLVRWDLTVTERVKPLGGKTQDGRLRGARGGWVMREFFQEFREQNRPCEVLNSVY
jgi:hypothetical protein